MTTTPMPILLIPGAWMGEWIWEDTIERLAGKGCTAHSLTLQGLERRATPEQVASVRLADHIEAVERAVLAIGGPLMVAGHSYSGLLAGMIADRLPQLVVHTTIINGFYPRQGRSLLDDWGPSAEARAQERKELIEAGMIWAPPPTEGLTSDPSLDSTNARWLGDRLQPHPGHTIADPATMQRPIDEQSVTVIADDGDARSTVPDELSGSGLSHWHFRSVPNGHWPMLGSPALLVNHLVEAATAAAERSR